jgi:hypothetical protein
MTCIDENHAVAAWTPPRETAFWIFRQTARCYATFAVRAATGVDFANQENIDRLLKTILPQPPAFRKIYDRGKFGRSPGGGSAS